MNAANSKALLLLALISLAMTGCSTLSLDAPSPKAQAEPQAGATTGNQSGDPLWLQEINEQPSQATTLPSANSLNADTSGPSYSSESLTHESGGEAPLTKAKALLQQAEERAKDAQAGIQGQDNSGFTDQAAALLVLQGFRIQLATLPDTETALRYWRELQQAHPAILRHKSQVLIELDLGYRGIQHRLEAGPYETLAAAWEACLALIRRKQGCAVGNP